MTLEPPKGIRNNVQGSYLIFTEEWFESSSQPRPFKKLVYGLCFFHALLVERKKFGPLGWNIPYTFSIPDLRITLDQLHLLLENYEDVPWKMFNYCTAQCNYGGQVTDDKDRRLITNIMTDFYTPDILNEDYKFSSSGRFYAPPEGDLQSSLSSNFHSRLSQSCLECTIIAIASAVSETTLMLNTVLGLQAKSASGDGKSF